MSLVTKNTSWLYEHNDSNTARFVLGTAGENPLICFGINPSTAEPDNLDPTLKRVQNYAKSYKFDSWIMLNIYPQRATIPDKISFEIDNDLHKQNIEHISRILKRKNLTLWAAWGGVITKRTYLMICLMEIAEIAATNECNWFSVGETSDGHPFHPLTRIQGFKLYNAPLKHFDINKYQIAANFPDSENCAVRRAERKRKENEKWLDAIRGCLIGGAVGDALGYPVEFLSLKEIQSIHSETGITEYSIDIATGKALISDDTQMTLFTANGILVGATRLTLRGIAAPVESYVHMAYLDWLFTQTGKASRQNISWLSGIKELHAKRAPGTTCMNALKSGEMGTIDSPINNSKGCGGVMRVAPVALYFRWRHAELPLDGAKVAAVTHGHPLGYLPAAALTHIINRIVYNDSGSICTLYEIVDECFDVLKELFAGHEYLNEFLEIMGLAVSLSKNNDPDAQNIARIGLGWVAEEALAISLYCSLKYYNDFSKAIIAAVNHDGDSDSTGAITGNIVGAHVGYEGISLKWKRDLQLHDIILEIADDLCYDCQMDGYTSYTDDDWVRKYIDIA